MILPGRLEEVKKFSNTDDFEELSGYFRDA